VVVAVIVALLVLVAAAGWFWFRLRTLGRRVGSFPCAIRDETGWASGIACYTALELRWYRVISLSPRPRHVWARGRFAILGPARPIDAGDGPSRGPLRSGSLVEVECRVRDAAGAESTMSLGISRGAYAGLASWLESAPPGAGLRRAIL